MTGSVTLQDRFDVTVLRPGGRARLRRTALPGPLHMGQALAGYQHLSYAERLRVVPAALAMTRLDPASPGLDGQRLGDWLAAHGQGEHARRALWDLFTVSALNVAGDDANLALAATVVKTALLSGRDAADIGIPAVPLGDLHGQAAASLLGRLRARVRLGAKAAAVEALPSGGFLVRLASRGAAAGQRRRRGDPGRRRGAGGPAGDRGRRLRTGPAAARPGRSGRGAGRRAQVGLQLAQRHLAHCQRARGLRPAGDQAAVRRGGGLAGAVGVRPDRAVGPARRPVPGDLAVGGGRLRRRPGRQAARAVPARAGGVCSPRRRRRGSSIASSPGSAGPRSRQVPGWGGCGPRPRPPCRAWSSRAPGPTPGGRTRWREPCGAD